MVFSIDAYRYRYNDILPFKAEGIKQKQFSDLPQWCGSIGLMYCFYFQSFRFLLCEVLLLVCSQIYIVINDILNKQFHKDIYLLL
jgi:hypothetical protein